MKRNGGIVKSDNPNDYYEILTKPQKSQIIRGELSMNEVFKFTTKNKIYEKCVYASIAHSIMVGKYTLLSSEICWDENNFLFQNMEGTRGVIAFSNNEIVCGILDEENSSICGESDLEREIFKDVENDIVDIIKEEVLPYLLVEIGNDSIPEVSTMFYSKNKKIYSHLSEKEFMKKSNNILLPYLYEESDMRRYWRDYYEINHEQEQLIEELVQQKKIEKSFKLNTVQKDKIGRWFGNNTTYCKSAMEEIGIIFE